MKIVECLKSGYGCLVKFLALIGLFVVAGILLLFVFIGAVVKMAGEELSGYGAERPECDRPLEKRWMCGTGGEEAPEVVFISLSGVIESASASTGLFSTEPLSSYAKALHAIRVATKDEKVKGLVLKLNTPGGTVTDSDVMADALRRFKTAGEGRFVLVQMGSLCCSGGYYIAAEADYIIAYPTTLTGSIGVIMSGFNASELAKKIGVKSVAIASGANKALLDPLEPINPAHVEILRRAVERDYARFVAIVARGRNLPEDIVRSIADGRVLAAEDALASRLIDALGYDEDVWKKAAELAHADAIRIYRYERTVDWSSLFSGEMGMMWGRAFWGGLTRAAADASSSARLEYRMR